MRIVSGSVSFAQRAFSLLVAAMLGTAAWAVELPPSPVSAPLPAAEPGSDIVDDLWNQLVRQWLEAVRRRVTRPMPPANSSIETLMLGTIECYESGGFPMFGPNEIPLDYKDAIRGLYNATFNPPSSVNPALVARFREVMVAVGATR